MIHLSEFDSTAMEKVKRHADSKLCNQKVYS